MKKVKIMLTAITVLTVVGGALAFKAKDQQLFCSERSSSAGLCTIDETGTWIAPSNPVQKFQSYCTTNENGACTTLSLIYEKD